MEDTKMMHISFELEFDHIPSENFMYHPRQFRGRLFLYKNEYVAAFQDKVMSHLRGIINKYGVPDRQEFVGIFAHHIIGYPIDSFWKRDVENSTKSLNDAVFNLFKEKQGYEIGDPRIIDDSDIISQYCKKIDSPTSFISSGYYFIKEQYDLTVLEIMNGNFARQNTGF